MKLITAIVRPEKLDELIGAVIDNRGRGLTVTEVRGFGRQFGELTARTAGAEAHAADLARESRVALLPKVRLDILVQDVDAVLMVEAIAKRARTEVIGDGKIWVRAVDSAMRVRTGERGRDAV